MLGLMSVEKDSEPIMTYSSQESHWKDVKHLPFVEFGVSFGDAHSPTTPQRTPHLSCLTFEHSYTQSKRKGREGKCMEPDGDDRHELAVRPPTIPPQGSPPCSGLRHRVLLTAVHAPALTRPTGVIK